MISIDIKLEGDGAFADVADEAQIGELFRVAALPAGMESGALSVALGVRGEDGTVVIAETSWRLLHVAVKAIEARYGTPT